MTSLDGNSTGAVKEEDTRQDLGLDTIATLIWLNTLNPRKPQVSLLCQPTELKAACPCSANPESTIVTIIPVVFGLYHFCFQINRNSAWKRFCDVL